MVFPWIPFLKNRGGRKLSDIEFLMVHEENGRLSTNEGGQAIATTGDLATITAGAGDMYLAKAHASVALSGTSNHTGLGTIVLKVNGTVKDTWNFSLIITSGEGATSMTDHDFLIGFKVTTGQIIKLECTVAGTSVLTEGQIECIEVATGTTVQIPSL